MSKNDSSARPARAVCICRPRPDSNVNWPNLRLCRGRENLTKHFKIYPKQPHRSCHFYSCNVDTHFPFRTTWGYNEIITITGNNIFRRGWRRRRPCVSSLQTSQCHKLRFEQSIITLSKINLTKAQIDAILFCYLFSGVVQTYHGRRYFGPSFTVSLLSWSSQHSSPLAHCRYLSLHTLRRLEMEAHPLEISLWKGSFKPYI